MIQNVWRGGGSATNNAAFPNTPFVLEPNGGTHVVPVTFRALGGGSSSATLTLDGTNNVAFSVPLLGTAGGPVANVPRDELTRQAVKTARLAARGVV